MRSSLLFAVISSIRKIPAEVDLRADFQINNCVGESLVANNLLHTDVKNASSWTSIGVNLHCSAPRTAYVVSGASCKAVNGLYEEYGMSTTGAHSKKWERVLDSGKTYRLLREYLPPDQNSTTVWMMRTSKSLLYINHQTSSYPPSSNGWTIVDPRFAKKYGNQLPQLKLHRWPRTEPTTVGYDPPTLLSSSSTEVDVSTNGESVQTQTTNRNQPVQKYLSTDGRLLDYREKPSPETALAESLLHPAVGPALGESLSARYRSALPFDAIALDGLLDDQMLRQADDFANVPLSEWVGPEEGAPCCKGKYRLDFDHWNSSAWARGLILLASRPRFISFLEGLTGIGGLLNMRIQDRTMVSYGSSLIGITSGGFLTVHNDFNYFGGLYRRLNVLLYLNSEWVDYWGGHIELWSGNMTRCVQRIAPLFNRMVIFTVTNDAFHGHPEPLTSPPDTLRYALQLVYYTTESGPTHSNRPGKKKHYKEGAHSAIFQPSCSELPMVKEFCETTKRPGPYGDATACECNYR